MTSRKSCSKGLVRDSMKRNLWALVLSVVGFFMAQLLPVLMTAQRGLTQHKQDLMNLSAAEAEGNWQGYVNNVASMLGGSNPFAKIVMIALAVVCGVSMFAYLHNRRKVDFYHSLPISRSRLFAVNYATGAACALVPYLVMHVLSAVCACAMGFGEAVNASLIGAMVSNIIFFFLLYALAVLTTIVCGNIIITLLLLLWVYFGPLAVNVLWQSLQSTFYDTYVSGSSAVQMLFANRLCPLMQFFGVSGTKFSWLILNETKSVLPSAVGLLVGYAVAAVVITALALFLFRIRKSERSGMALAFTPVKLPIKIIICAVMGTAFAQIFYLIMGDMSLWFWVGLVLGTVLFHCIVEIIYAFDFRAIFCKPIHLVVILAVLAAGMLTMKMDVFGYDTWLPDEGSIKAVLVEGFYGGDDSNALADPENIAAVRRLAEIGVQNPSEKELIAENPSSGHWNYATLGFEMKNGSIKNRTYMLPETDEVEQLEKQVYQSAEYKQKNWSLFNLGEVQPDYHREISIYSNGGGYDSVAEIQNAEQINAVIDTLRAECVSYTGDAMPVLRLEFAQANNNDYYSEGAVCVTEKDVKTLALIKQYTGAEPTPMGSSDKLKSVEVSVYDKDSEVWKNVEVTDPADRKALLENAVNIDAMNLYGTNDTAYGIITYFGTANVSAYFSKGNGQWSGQLGYTIEHAPTALIEKYAEIAKKQPADSDNTVATESDAVEALG